MSPNSLNATPKSVVFLDNAAKLGILGKTNKDVKGLPMTVRSVFILKTGKKIALMMTYPASTGSNFDKIICVLVSLQLTTNKYMSTLVNWR